jgi:hypothetical protein
MVVVPLPRQANDLNEENEARRDESLSWVGIAAGGTLVASGLMILAGQRRAGAVAAASGAALALLDQQDTLTSWWHSLPRYIDEVQRVLDKVQDTVNDVAAKRETLRRILAK